MSDKILSDLRRIAQTYPTRGTQDAVIAAVDEIQRLRSDLAAARSLLAEANLWVREFDDDRGTDSLYERIRAALAREKNDGP